MSNKQSVKAVARRAKATDAAIRKKITNGKKNWKTQDSFQNFAANFGIGTDNLTSGSTYGFNPITRIRTLIEWMYRGSWIAGIAVNCVADDMTRASIDFKGGQLDPKDKEKLMSASRALGLNAKTNEVIRWARLYGGCVGVLMIDGQDMSTPLRIETIGKNQFKGLLVLDRWMVEPTLEDLVTDYGPSIGLPKFYNVTADAPALRRAKIHHSRCVFRMVGVELPYWQRVMENLWGISVFERLYDRMVAFDSATQGASQLVYKSYLRTLKVKEMRKAIGTGGQALAKLVEYTEMTRRFQGVEGLTLIDADDDLTASTHNAFSGLSDALMQFGQQLSGALQVPLTRLFGQSPAGFNTGDSDIRTYYDGIKQKQELEMEAPETMLYRVLAKSVGVNLPEGFRVQRRSLWQMTDTEKADYATKVSQSVSTVEESGIIDRATALKELRESSEITGIFSHITDEDITEAESEGPPVPDDIEVAEIRAGAKENQPLPKPGAQPDDKQATGEVNSGNMQVAQGKENQ